MRNTLKHLRQRFYHFNKDHIQDGIQMKELARPGTTEIIHEHCCPLTTRTHHAHFLLPRKGSLQSQTSAVPVSDSHTDWCGLSCVCSKRDLYTTVQCLNCSQILWTLLIRQQKMWPVASLRMFFVAFWDELILVHGASRVKVCEYRTLRLLWYSVATRQCFWI